ncbi:indole-3-glycerol phosphate synthase TrpC [Thermospira aquatica]|uniref:indole-3-glycerol-phosphate synthase n=1 Tax=Thermospira aquatica TaxID=2828656 RepID=A0AAX3BD47_9SPIR|nr:indole-3-glycerol phosphate synthase TrpC [Thermospira aquatica]URA10110.1 indole-3-glycerol-phosphate synthase [Thermospira aquatica]
MMNILKEILEYKKKEIENFRQMAIRPLAKKTSEGFLFQNKLSETRGIFVIAEVKRKSPSQGAMAMESDPISIALEYKEGGADAISVLTDEHFFGGSFAFLQEIKETTGLPVLCKDFIIDESQIDMASFYKADMILLIAEAFDHLERLDELFDYARSLGLDVLVEVHDPNNILALRDKNYPIIGINNRDLRTLKEDWQYSLQVAELLPKESYKLSLSAFSQTDEITHVIDAGYDGILVGTTLVKNPHRISLLREWKSLSK